MSKRYAGSFTVVGTNPLTGKEFVARRCDTRPEAERARAQLTRGGLAARCEPWKPSDKPGQQWRPK